MVGVTIEQLLPYIFTAVASLGGSWIAITSALRIHDWRLNEQKAMLLDHAKKHESHDNRITYLEAFHGKGRRSSDT